MKTALFYKNGSSDKVYQVQLDAVEGGWVVNFQYGARGKAMASGTKTKEPVDYEVAKKAYDALVRSKMAKGYTEDGSGVAYTNQDKEVTGYLPQLLNVTTEEEIIELFNQGKTIYLQTKWDGERRGIMANDTEAIGANRKGLAIALREDIRDSCIALARQCGGSVGLDTEDMGNYLKVFDVWKHGDEDLRPLVFGIRAGHLSGIYDVINACGLGKHLDIDLPLRVRSVLEIQEFIHLARASNEEGIVCRLDKPYTPGRPNSGGPCLKLKFVEDATIMVSSVHPSKRSIGMIMWNGGMWTEVGNCSVPTNYVMPDVDDVCDIKYLYAYRGGSIFQPVFKGRRLDLDATAAHINQLKYKA